MVADGLHLLSRGDRVGRADRGRPQPLLDASQDEDRQIVMLRLEDVVRRDEHGSQEVAVERHLDLPDVAEGPAGRRPVGVDEADSADHVLGGEHVDPSPALAEDDPGARLDLADAVLDGDPHRRGLQRFDVRGRCRRAPEEHPPDSEEPSEGGVRRHGSPNLHSRHALAATRILEHDRRRSPTR